ncbi:MAG: MFS transporter [Deltaproteobacteria bacterium]|nr:MFS transporter [Deltaproteobacteria bacterium]MBW2447470.1 MFS transporter [Deltaproteobacteria bacterium]
MSTPPAEPVPRTIRLWYGLGSLPGGVGATTATFLVFYYNQVLGVPGAQIGFALLVASVFDAVTDPLAGVLSDATRSRLGRRHPYLFATAVPIAISFYALWAPPAGLGNDGLLAWLVALLLLGRLFGTFYSVPYLALGAEITKDYEERSSLTATRSIFSNVGRAASGGLLLLVFLRPTPEFENGQMNPEGYHHFAILFSGIALVALVASAWKTRHAIANLSVAARDAPAISALRGLVGEISSAIRLKAFRAFLLCSVSKHIGWGVSDALGLYMATYFWHVGTEGLFIWGVGMFSGLFLGFSFWRRHAVGREKKTIYILGTVLYLTFFCLPYVMKVAGLWPGQDSPLYFPLYVFVTGFLAHFFQAGTSIMGGSMLGDLTDLDELEQGRRREGVLFGAESFGWKALVGIGSLIAGFTVDLVGLEPGMAPEDVPVELSNLLGLAQGGVMTVLMVVALIFIRQYDLTRARHREVRDTLEARARENREST